MKTRKLNILIPTDFSDNAWNAVVYILKFYEEYVCTFYFLHSVKMAAPKTTLNSGKLTEVLSNTAKEELKDLKSLAETSNANDNHSFETVLSNDTLNSAIEFCVKKYNIDLVVMGTKGATGAKEVLFGSNTVNAIKKMRVCPVIIIPEEFDFVTPKQIAFPTNFNRAYNKIELNTLKSLALVHDSKIRVVHIEKSKELSAVQQNNVQNLKNALEEFEVSFHWMPHYTNLTEEINDFIEELKIDVLAMVNYKHSFIEDLMHEPVITKIGHRLKIPFLVIPD
ncbi:universal stress protein [Mariniflexile sp.]|uniref:universal stress protein n=1 Tax=Mariniflexile sp. TaxID=1979402 RepID=UPI003567BEA7